MASRARTRLERAAARAGSTLAGFGGNGRYAIFRDNATGRRTQIPLPSGKGGGAGSNGG